MGMKSKGLLTATAGRHCEQTQTHPIVDSDERKLETEKHNLRKPLRVEITRRLLVHQQLKE